MFSFMGDTNCDRLRNHGALSALPSRKCLRRCTVNGFDCPWGRGLNKTSSKMFQDVTRHILDLGALPLLSVSLIIEKNRKNNI